ncbi:aminopeptidase P family protein [Gordonia humi]|uniref:Xaa-Pro aminopeptidase n=1 Tax=Gordonia humi TaxID=686429 RepID=A0A840F8I2_9ACTN|nr:aminopeptidase P family protein [Gordonia humi]MBB4136490.1 Xaa-Pro aminopeptidase [Gordonia humi]
MSNHNSARRTALAASASLGEADSIVVSDPTNLRYLTGFTGSNGAAIVWTGDDRADDRISTDGRYITQVAEQTPDLTAIIVRDCPAELVRYAGTVRPGSRIAIEGHVMPVADYRRLVDLAAETGSSIVPVGDAVERLRIAKDPDEVELITSACRIGDDALARLIARGAIAPGRTERQVARDLEWAMFDLGADAIAFETIVATGQWSAVPHHRPTDAVLATGDLVKIDFGAVVGGYHSDMTRTFVLGSPADWQREIYDVVATAQRAGRDALAVGADLAGIDAAARSVIADAGYGPRYVHGLGHGVGLQIHEAPGIGAAASGTLPDGATVTVEPGIYLPGRGGVRIEDTLVVTDAGPRSLTTASRALTAL